MTFMFDTAKDGFQTVMKDYQEICMRYLWEVGEEGANSGKVWVHVSKVLMEEERSISRASIIFFMNDMVDKGVLNYRSKSGKGGYHRIYFPIFDEEGFKRHLAETVISKLSQMWPEATRKAIEAHVR